MRQQQGAWVTRDGRAFGHLPYGDAAETELVAVPPIWVGIRVSCAPRSPDLARLIAAARRPGQVRALSCHRSIARYQQAVFCRGEQHRGRPRAVGRAAGI